MKMAPKVDPRLDKVPEQELMTPELVFSMAAEHGIVFGKILRRLGFFRGDEYIVRRASRGDDRGVEAAPTRDQ